MLTLLTRTFTTLCLLLLPVISSAVGTQFNNQCNAVSWNANSETDLAGYRLYDRGTSPTGTPLVIATTAVGVTSRTCSSLNFTPGQHYISVAAFDTTGNESARSADVPFLIVQTNVMNDLAVESVTSSSLTMGWTEVDGGNGSPAKYDFRFSFPPIAFGSAPSVVNGTCATPVAGTTIGAHKTCTITGLNAAQSYQVQAVPFRGTLNVDAVFSPLSNIASGVTDANPPTDTTPPSQVTGMGVQVIDSSHLTVTSATATDNVGVTAYLTERCQGVGCTSFVQVVVSPSTTFPDSNLQANTTYCYRRRAQDGATPPNLGLYSVPACGTTSPGPVVLPTITSNVPTVNGAFLAWSAGTVAVRIQTDFGSTIYLIADLPGGVLSRIWRQGETFECAFAINASNVENTDPAGYICGSLAGLITVDVTAPAISNFQPTGTLASGTTSTTLSWRATDATGPAVCEVHSTDQPFGSPTNLLTNALTGTTLAGSNNGVDFTFGVTGLTSPSTTNYFIACRDSLTPTPNVSANTMVTVTVAAAPADVTAPTTITDFFCTVAGPEQISYTFTPATDAVGVVANEVAICQGLNCGTTFNIVATWANTSPQVLTGLVANTPYTARIRAFDAAGNRAAYSSDTTCITANAPDVVPPSDLILQFIDPSLYNAVTLVWPAGTDNTAVASSTIERCQGQDCENYVAIGTTTQNVFVDHTVRPLTIYKYRGKFKDTSGNVSANYTPLTVITPDVPAGTEQAVCPCRNRYH